MASSYAPDDMSTVSSISELNLACTSSSLTLFSSDEGGSSGGLDGSVKQPSPVQNETHKCRPPQMSQIDEETTSNILPRNTESAADMSPDELSFECTEIAEIMDDCPNDKPNTDNTMTEAIGDSLECLEECDFNSEKTQDLLQHYLTCSDSTDELKFYTMDFYKYITIMTKTFVEFMNFMLIVVMNKHFWNSCVMIAHIGIAVFFYLVLAMSTIMVTIIVNLHDATVYCNKIQSKENKMDEEEKACSLQKFVDIDEISI